MSFCTMIGAVVAKDETREELRRIPTAQVAPTRAEPDCINYVFDGEEEDPYGFMSYENWRTEADLDTPLKTPRLQPPFGRLDELSARPVEMRFYQISSEREDLR